MIIANETKPINLVGSKEGGKGKKKKNGAGILDIHVGNK